MPIAAASPQELHCGEVGAGDEEKEKVERERADADARQFSDRELLEKLQRIQTALTSGMACRLRDRGRKLRATLDGIHREQERRKAHRSGARGPGNDRCERVIQSRRAESSGFPTEANRDKVSLADFKSSFGMDKKAGIDISSLKITSRSPNMPNTLIENEGKLCKEKDTCESSSQPMNSFHEELHLDTSANIEKTSDDNATNDNGRNRTCEVAPTSSRKRTLLRSLRLRVSGSRWSPPHSMTLPSCCIVPFWILFQQWRPLPQPASGRYHRLGRPLLCQFFVPS